MKTVLLITPSGVHQRLYAGLARRFETSLSSAEVGAGVTVSAVIYDAPDLRTSLDLRLVAHLDCPLVVLTPESGLRLPADRPHRVLRYPVSVDEIVAALRELGVEP